jgi:formylglycine-generating enzyme required for sulfatase activity
VLNWASSALRPVGSFPAGASPFGILDAAGNVAELTATKNERGLVGVKGGSRKDLKPDAFDAGAVRWVKPETREPTLGFRCAWDVAPGRS